jgi:hypothetical protein
MHFVGDLDVQRRSRAGRRPHTVVPKCRHPSHSPTDASGRSNVCIEFGHAIDAPPKTGEHTSSGGSLERAPFASRRDKI